MEQIEEMAKILYADLLQMGFSRNPEVHQLILAYLEKAYLLGSIAGNRTTMRELQKQIDHITNAVFPR